MAVLLFAVGLMLGVAPASSAGPEPTWSRWFRPTMHGLDTGPDRTVVTGNTREGYPGGKVVLARLKRNGDIASRSAWSPKDGHARVTDLAVYAGDAHTTG